MTRLFTPDWLFFMMYGRDLSKASSKNRCAVVASSQTITADFITFASDNCTKCHGQTNCFLSLKNARILEWKVLPPFNCLAAIPLVAGARTTFSCVVRSAAKFAFSIYVLQNPPRASMKSKHCLLFPTLEITKSKTTRWDRLREPVFVQQQSSAKPVISWYEKSASLWKSLDNNSWSSKARNCRESGVRTVGLT